ncbi:MAG: MFS transporter [Brevefilum sp.]|nr:MFS transporter [Brevefilum sp.]MDT8382612.1 MFS transporter [Brevefilum sp.]MDW7754999.1 MFS transporter [Brevefilum sp.]
MTIQEVSEPRKLSFKYKFYWGIAALGTSLISGIYGGLLTIFYQDYLGLSARWIGIAATVYALWNAFNDPLFGYITDNTRSKQGRRIPYMRFTAPFLALTFILVWFAPPQAGQQTLFWWMLGSMLLYDTCYTIIGLVYSSLLPELTESDAQRNGLQISSSLFSMLGTLLGFMIPDFVRPKTGESSLVPLYIAMIAVGIIGMILILITTFKIKERREFAVVDKPVPPIEAIKFTFTSKAFLVLVAENFMAILMSSLILGSIYYLADYVLQWPAMQLLAFLFIPLILSIPLTTVIRKRLGVVGAQQFLLVLAGIGLIAVAFVPKALIPVCIALAGVGLAGPQTLTNVLFAQVADEDELRSGQRREGAFFGINALITKPAQSIALWITPFILERTNFITRASNAGEIFLGQPANAIMGIKIFAGVIPGVACLLGALLLMWYPLRGERLTEVQKKVLVLHKQKKQQFEEQYLGE